MDQVLELYTLFEIRLDRQEFCLEILRKVELPQFRGQISLPQKMEVVVEEGLYSATKLVRGVEELMSGLFVGRENPTRPIPVSVRGCCVPLEIHGAPFSHV